MNEIPTGWVCPICGTANAPHVPQCPCRNLPQGSRKSTATVPQREPQMNRNGNATVPQSDVAVAVAGEILSSKALEPNNLQPRKNHHYPAGFEAFWEVYPLRKDKAAALRAWKRAVTQVDADTLREAALRYRNDPQRKPDFTKYPATWLNAGAWDDEDGVDKPPPMASTDDRYKPYNPDEYLADMEKHVAEFLAGEA